MSRPPRWERLGERGRAAAPRRLCSPCPCIRRFVYASIHGYQYGIDTRVIDPTRPLPWQKVLSLIEWLGQVRARLGPVWRAVMVPSTLVAWGRSPY